MTCPLCGNTETRITVVPDRYRCPGCCWFRWPVQPPVPHAVGAPSPVNPDTERQRFLGIVRSIPGAGRLHDIGCGDGGLLAAAQFLGWEVTGNDLRLELPETVLENFGIPIILAAYEDVPCTNLDAITLHHGIEHLPDPIGTLRKAWRDLVPGGHVLLIHPAISSEEAFPLEADRSVRLGAHCFEWMPEEFRKVIDASGAWTVVRHVVSGGCQHWLLQK